MNDDETTLLTRSRLRVDRDRLADASADLARRVAHSQPRRRRRSRIAVGMTALLVAVPATAAATGVLDDLRTGLFGQPDRFTEDAGTSEWLNICSPSYPGLIRQHTPDGPLPASTSWARATSLQIEQARRNPDCVAGRPGARQQEIGIDSWFAHYASCSWYAEAARADDADDAAGVRRAGQELKVLANSRLNHTIDGGGIVEWDNRIADAVLAGDVAGARQAARHNCEIAR